MTMTRTDLTQTQPGTQPTTSTTNAFLTSEQFGRDLNTVGDETTVTKERKQLEHQGLLNASTTQRTQVAGDWMAVDTTINGGAKPTTPLNVLLAPVVTALLKSAPFNTKQISATDVRKEMNNLTTTASFTVGKVRARVMTSELPTNREDRGNLARFATELTLQVGKQLGLIDRTGVTTKVENDLRQNAEQVLLTQTADGEFVQICPGILIVDINRDMVGNNNRGTGKN